MLNIVYPTSAVRQESAPFTLLGNRGVLHDSGRLIRHSQGDRWIYCVTSALSDPAEFMSSGKVTELFFLDETTALAAGHRPCDRCNHARFRQFASAWEKANGVKGVTAREIDSTLTVHRSIGTEQVTFRADASTLPAGVIIRELGRLQPLLLHRYEHPKGQVNWCAYPWTSRGYGVKEDRPIGEVEVLTPRATVDVIRAGFEPGPRAPLLAWG